MGKIYPLGQDCQYLLTRAARHRRAGRYDQAMTLLARAKRQFADREEVEFELAVVYDEMGCENEAADAYLRVARMRGKLSAQALFHLAISSAQRADLNRAVSYYEAFLATDREGISAEAAQLLQRQLLSAIKKKPARTRRQRAKALQQRAVERLNAGKFHAAKRTITRSLSFHDSAQSHVFKACCHLITSQGEQAVKEAHVALLLNPGHLQARCVLADACILTGERTLARKTIIDAARKANSNEALFSVAVECAKNGLDKLTLILTKRLLKREPFHTRALAMRACAYVNLGRMKTAQKLFARLCVLLPESSVFDAYYRACLEGKPFSQRLTMAQDVTAEEAMARSVKLLSILHEDPDSVRADQVRIDEICLLCRWAIHSPMAGANVTLMAIIVLSVVNTQKTQAVLFDALIDPNLDDGLKNSVLQALSMHSDQMPYYADLGGRFVRLAAGTTVSSMSEKDVCQDVVQRAAASLMTRYPDAAGELLELWVRYLDRYGAVRGRMADACASALEYVYHLQAGRTVSMKTIAGKHGASRRLSLLCAGRILRAGQQQDKTEE